MYNFLIGGNLDVIQNSIWKIKIPARIKFFLWLLRKKSILTRDNLARRGWVGDTDCAFCGQHESQTHLFFQCSMARLLWNILMCTFNLVKPPDNLDDLLENWILQFDKKNWQI